MIIQNLSPRAFVLHCSNFCST